MKPFITIAKPHKDIRQGNLTMDIFAADLWEVFKDQAPKEYKDPKKFFEKTYLTTGLKNLIEVASKRLKGQGGDAVIQLQTPFGGGKTHGLIALYHKAKEWGAKVVVLDGAAFDAKRKLWEELEKQLTGEVNLLKGNTAPGKDKLTQVLRENLPALILIDELLEYTTKAAGEKVGDSSLAAQTFAFIQELTGTVSTLGNALLVVTLPSSALEHYDKPSEKLFQQLQKILGRREKVYTPVRDDEIELIVRRRLFSYVNEAEAEKVIDEFIKYAESEELIPEEEIFSYKRRFLKSYPFQPEVIDVLYKRWGSFPTFQRTRGVLRLLALVVYSMLNSERAYIRLGDFNLEDQEIRRELLKHIGSEYDSVISSDITGENSGAKKVDVEIGDAYRRYKLGTVVANAIFMYSHSGGPDRGATIREIKMSSVDPAFPGSIVDTVINNLREKLFYLSDEGLFFTNKPNLNRLLLIKKETISEDTLREKEEELLKQALRGGIFEIYIWPEKTKDVPDNRRLKLVILRECDRIEEFIHVYGNNPRVYRNTLIFLCGESERQRILEDKLRESLAWQQIWKDERVNLTEEQRRSVQEKMQRAEIDAENQLKNFYRKVYLPSKDGKKERYLGASASRDKLDEEVYGNLKGEEILEKISPLFLERKYLKEREFVGTRDIFETFLRTPGEVRIASEEVLRESIREGVKKGMFGLGYQDNGNVECKKFKEDVLPEIVDGEVIIKDTFCKEKEEREPGQVSEGKRSPYTPGTKEGGAPLEREKKYKGIYLKFKVLPGKLSDLILMLNNLKEHFEQIEIQITISATDGEIGISAYEDHIEETLKQIHAEKLEEKLDE